MFAGILVQFAAIAARMAGITIPHRVLNGAFLLVLAAPLITAVAFNIAPADDLPQLPRDVAYW